MADYSSLLSHLKISMFRSCGLRHRHYHRGYDRSTFCRRLCMKPCATHQATQVKPRSTKAYCTWNKTVTPAPSCYLYFDVGRIPQARQRTQHKSSKALGFTVRAEMMYIIPPPSQLTHDNCARNALCHSTKYHSRGLFCRGKV
jgi:hypothetical protein